VSPVLAHTVKCPPPPPVKPLLRSGRAFRTYGAEQVTPSKNHHLENSGMAFRTYGAEQVTPSAPYVVRSRPLSLPGGQASGSLAPLHFR